jgi:hypothetical protein
MESMKKDARKSEKGQGTLEFLILVPMMFLMISLVLFAGWWTYGKLAAQNAAYSYAVFAPLTQIGLNVGRAANLEAGLATLEESIGMKQMWGEDVPTTYLADAYGHSRLSGTGMTVSISPRGLSWEEYLAMYEATGIPSPGTRLPRGTAFFFYSPLMSASQQR